MRLGIYIHIPFCASKCAYCDFNSYAGLDQLIPRYVDSLVAETHSWQGQKGKTVYFGGGTPSLLSSQQIGGILEACFEAFDLGQPEVTLEANPGTVSKSYLRQLREIGVNRLSLGVQSFHDRELQLLGRRHGADEAVEAYRAAREAGFANINLDFIFGLPGQGLADWETSLEIALGLSPEHLSLYHLTLEEDTPLGQRVSSGQVASPDPDLAAEMYTLAEERLEKAGYRHYEISNWCRPGRECQHNLTYWRNQPYLGLGAGAHSFLGQFRFFNILSPEEYTLRLERGESPEAGREQIDQELEMAETIILGLRLEEGVAGQELVGRFGSGLERYQEEVKELVELGLLRRQGDRIGLTPWGRLLGNEVFIRFLPQRLFTNLSSPAPSLLDRREGGN